MYKTKAYSARSASSLLAGPTIARRDPTEHDVQIEILFCGICHSDLHSGALRKSAQELRSTSRAPSPQSVAWLTLTAPARAVKLDSGIFVRT